MDISPLRSLTNVISKWRKPSVSSSYLFKCGHPSHMNIYRILSWNTQCSAEALQRGLHGTRASNSCRQRCIPNMEATSYSRELPAIHSSVQIGKLGREQHPYSYIYWLLHERRVTCSRSSFFTKHCGIISTHLSHH